MPGLNYISENSGFLTSGEDKFKSGVSAIADALVSVSRKLALGKFDKIINPDYFKNLSQNINSYINIIKSVEESDADYDSVSDMADSMVELAKAYDKLGTAIQGLNGQLGGVDLEKMTMLKNLAGSVVMLSLMDSAQFESMMDSLESKAKILLDVVNDTKESTAKQASATTPAAGDKLTVSGNTKIMGTATIDTNLVVGGSVGIIGTTTMTNATLLNLDIVKTSTTAGDLINMRYDTPNGLRINQAYVAANDIKQIFIQKNNNVDSNTLTIYKGNIGIGTTAPTNILQVGAGGR
jgi:hypothetical protein